MMANAKNQNSVRSMASTRSIYNGKIMNRIMTLLQLKDATSDKFSSQRRKLSKTTNIPSPQSITHQTSDADEDESPAVDATRAFVTYPSSDDYTVVDKGGSKLLYGTAPLVTQSSSRSLVSEKSMSSMKKILRL
jgi:hypothetical protein